MIPRPCDCGRDALQGGYCSKQCELRSIVADQGAVEGEPPSRRWPTKKSDRRVRLAERQYHGENTRDDV